MTRYVIVGGGAVGASTAAQLHEAGREVVLVARGEQLAALRADGLRYVTAAGTRQLHLPVAGGPDEVELRADDVLVLAVKSQDTEAALQQWAWRPVRDGRSAAEDVPVLLLQNGLANAHAALRRFDVVLDAVILVPATYLRPGEVVSSAAPHVGTVYVGTARGSRPGPLDDVTRDLRAAGFQVQPVADVAAWKAGKLLANLAYNLDALLPEGPHRERVAHAVRAEAEDVLAAAGRAVLRPGVDDDLDLTLATARPVPGYERGGSSTWQSLTRGGSSESDFLNGEIVLLAREAGVPAPVNRAVQVALARVAREGSGPSSLSAQDVLALLPDDARSEVLVDVPTLAAALRRPGRPLLLDVRWALGDPHGRDHYLHGRIPTAVYVDLDRELAAHTGDPRDGRHPLPSIQALQEAARGWGLRNGRSVVVYDDNGGQSAARAWWLLRWAGITDVRILDGALPAWTAAGHGLDLGEPAPPTPGDVVLTAGSLPVLGADEAAALPEAGLLLDARAGERYRGETEPVDPRAGHVPGAVSAPTGENLDGAGHFADTGALRRRFAELGARPGTCVGVYCGSGVTATHQIAALAAAGIDAALFPGSWSAWSNDPDRPVATGPSPVPVEEFSS